jgi:predicted NBD/HSP70 family sugar kinase
VGVTFPGIIQHGVVHSAANVDKSWLNTDIDALLTARLGRPVEVINDADAAGLAEARYGAGAGVAGTVLVITLGTGIGSAFIFDGKLVPNAELGHLEIDGHDAETKASAVARERDGLSWGRIQRPAAALLLPRRVPVLPRTVHRGRRHLQARRRIPAQSQAPHRLSCRRSSATRPASWVPPSKSP